MILEYYIDAMACKVGKASVSSCASCGCPPIWEGRATVARWRARVFGGAWLDGVSVVTGLFKQMLCCIVACCHSEVVATTWDLLRCVTLQA